MGYNVGVTGGDGLFVPNGESAISNDQFQSLEEEMNKHLWWSVVVSLAAFFCLTFATVEVAMAQPDARIVGTGPGGLSIDYPVR